MTRVDERSEASLSGSAPVRAYRLLQRVVVLYTPKWHPLLCRRRACSRTQPPVPFGTASRYSPSAALLAAENADGHHDLNFQRSSVSFALRFVVSVSLLAYVAWKIDWPEIRQGLATADPAWLGAAFIAFNGAMVIAGIRWGAIVRAGARQRVRLPWTTAVRATYVSLWLSNFLPTAFGGDIARIVAARRAGVRLAASLSGAMFDRYLGLTVLAVLFLLSEAGLAAVGHSRPFLPTAVILAVGFGMPLVLVWHASSLSLPRKWLRLRVVRFIARTTGIVGALRTQPASSAYIVATSIAATVVGVGAYWCAIRSLGAVPSFSTALAAAALGTLASALPVSVSGWGVREGAVAWVLSQSGTLSASHASVVAICNAAVIAVTSLVGLATLLATRAAPPQPLREARTARSG